MEKLIPYVNVQTIADDDGNVVSFQVCIAAYVPGSVTHTEVGPVGDDVKYRPLTMYYTGETTDDFAVKDVKIEVERKYVGILERGVYVSVAKESDGSGLKNPEDEGVTIDYEDIGD